MTKDRMKNMNQNNKYVCYTYVHAVCPENKNHLSLPQNGDYFKGIHM
jgi:hypothetical protein